MERVGRFEKHTLPDGSSIFFDPQPHRYYGEVHPSKSAAGGYAFVRDSSLIGVSTPTKCLDTNVDPLLYWSAKLDQVGIAQLASLCLDDGSDLDWLRDQRSIAAALRDAELTWDKVRDRTAVRGTAIHERIFHALATGERPPSLSDVSAEDRGYGQAAMKWWMKRQPKPLFAEQVTYCAEHRLAGRFDLLCEIEGHGRVLVDAKTREKGAVRRSDHVQLPGYELCNVSCGIGPSDLQLALILTPWGDFIESWCQGTQGDFLAALDAYRRGNALEKRIKAAEKADDEPAPVAA